MYAEGPCLTKKNLHATEEYRHNKEAQLKKKTGKLSTVTWKQKVYQLDYYDEFEKKTILEKLADKPDQTAFRTSLS